MRKMLMATIMCIRGLDESSPIFIMRFNNIEELMEMFFVHQTLSNAEDDSVFHIKINEYPVDEPFPSIFIKLHIFSIKCKKYRIFDYPNTEAESDYIDCLIKNANYIYDQLIQNTSDIDLVRAAISNKKGLELLKHTEMFSMNNNMNSLEKDLLLESFDAASDIAERAYIALYGKELSIKNVNNHINMLSIINATYELGSHTIHFNEICSNSIMTETIDIITENQEDK